MNIRKNICSLICAVMAVSALCIPAYAAEEKSADKPEIAELTSVKVEDGVIAYNPDKTNGEILSKMDELLTESGFYPFEIRCEEHLGKPRIIKSYRVPADYDPMKLAEEDFEEDGYRYTKQDILEDVPAVIFDRKVVAEPITFTTEDNKQETLRAALKPVMEYDEGGYRGQLTIDFESIVSLPSGEANYSYPIVKTEEIKNLESNDCACIRKQMNGLTLTDVDWEVQSGADDRVPDLYTAYATYKGTGYGKKVTEYSNTAFYTGTVSREMNGDKICSVIYQGERIFPWKSLLSVTVGAALAGGIFTAAAKKRKHGDERGETENE